MLDSGSVSIRLKNRPYVPIMINGQGPLSFLLDTGSHGTNLSMDLAEKLSLQPDDRGVVHIDEFRIGSAKFTDFLMPLRDNTRVCEISGARVDGFIGNVFLSRLVLHIDYPKRKLRVTDELFGQFDQAVEMRLCHDYPLVPVTIQDEGLFWFLLDTGASRSIVSEDLADSLHLQLGESGKARGAVDSKQIRRSSVERISVGSSFRENLPVDVMDCSHVSEYAQTEVHGYIGHNFLEPFSVLANFSECTISIY